MDTPIIRLCRGPFIMILVYVLGTRVPALQPISTTPGSTCATTCPTHTRFLLGVPIQQPLQTDYCKFPEGGCPSDQFSISGLCISAKGLVVIGAVSHPTFIQIPGSRFRLATDGAERSFLAWPDAGHNTGWLVMADSLSKQIGSYQLFTSLTPQTLSVPLTGMNALARYDSIKEGGNQDGLISSKDQIYHRLFVWTDTDQDAHIQPGELRSLSSLEISTIPLHIGSSDINGCIPLDNKFSTKDYKICDSTLHAQN